MNGDETKVNGESSETSADRTRQNGNENGKRRNGTPQFDWIRERAECSLPKVFATLRSQLEQDVKARNELRPKTAPYEFSVKDDINEITVRLQANELEKAVTFALGDQAISVRGDGSNRMFDITLSFDDMGKCRLNVDGAERDFWQVRRMALEELMFRGL